MTDVHSPEVRSKNMRAIRSADTKPELIVRKGLHAEGLRYRLGGVGLCGRPDLVLPKYKAVIFVHGCFWHGHDCNYFKPPNTRREFWEKKIHGNRERDAKVVATLAASGWRIAVVWECAIKTAAGNSRNTTLNNLISWIKTGNAATFETAAMDFNDVLG
jgi:DNA mismatch endonuclease (patch repair protein)